MGRDIDKDNPHLHLKSSISDDFAELRTLWKMATSGDQFFIKPGQRGAGKVPPKLGFAFHDERDAAFEEALAHIKANWGDVSYTTLGRRDGTYDEVMDSIHYRVGREEYIKDLEARLAAAVEDGRRWQEALGLHTRAEADLRERLAEAEFDRDMFEQSWHNAANACDEAEQRAAGLTK